MPISQPRNKIFKICKRLKLSTHNVLLTGAMGPKPGFFCIHLRIKKNHFFQMLISQPRNKIFKICKRLKLSTHYVLLTGAMSEVRGANRFVEHLS